MDDRTVDKAVAEKLRQTADRVESGDHRLMSDLRKIQVHVDRDMLQVDIMLIGAEHPDADTVVYNIGDVDG